MAVKGNFEGLSDAKKEDRKESKKFTNGTETSDSQTASQSQSQSQSTNPPSPDQDTVKTEPASGTQSTPPPIPPPVQPGAEPARDEFKERFEEYFKGVGGLFTGDLIVGWVDGLKADLLFLYAKKNKIEVTKDMFTMDAKSRKFAAFCVDEVVGKNIFEWIRKYPLLGALVPFGVSIGGSLILLRMLKGSNEENKKKDEENAELKRTIAKMNEEKRKAAHAGAQTVNPVSEVKNESEEETNVSENSNEDNAPSLDEVIATIEAQQ